MKYLPHIDLDGHYQFITFRMLDSVDSFLKKMAQNDLPNNNKKQLAIDQYLDQSCNGAYLHGEVLGFLSDFLKQKDTALYELIAFCIMPNHVHLLVKPLGDLARMIQLIMGGSAKLINTKMERKGSFWFADYYDKLIRDDKHFSVVYKYIQNNPTGLVETTTPRFYGIYN